MSERVFVFPTTHHALWAEDVANEAGIPAEVLPAPTESKAGCDLALRTRPDDLVALTQALTNEGLRFSLWPPVD